MAYVNRDDCLPPCSRSAFNTLLIALNEGSAPVVKKAMKVATTFFKFNIDKEDQNKLVNSVLEEVVKVPAFKEDRKALFHFLRQALEAAKGKESAIRKESITRGEIGRALLKAVESVCSAEKPDLCLTSFLRNFVEESIKMTDDESWFVCAKNFAWRCNINWRLASKHRSSLNRRSMGS